MSPPRKLYLADRFLISVDFESSEIWCSLWFYLPDRNRWDIILSTPTLFWKLLAWNFFTFVIFGYANKVRLLGRFLFFILYYGANIGFLNREITELEETVFLKTAHLKSFVIDNFRSDLILACLQQFKYLVCLNGPFGRIVGLLCWGCDICWLSSSMTFPHLA